MYRYEEVSGKKKTTINIYKKSDLKKPIEIPTELLKETYKRVTPKRATSINVAF